MVLSEIEYIEYKNEIVKNLIADETAYAIDTKEQYVRLRDVWVVLKQEIEEAQEDLEYCKSAHDSYWEFIRGNMPRESMIKQLEIISNHAEALIKEAIQVAAVANKGIEELGNTNKTHATDQSKHEPLVNKLYK